MDQPIYVRRCAIVLLEPKHRIELDLAGLVGSGDLLRRTRSLIAHAPHLDEPVELGDEAAHLLTELDEQEWQTWAVLRSQHDASMLALLVDRGLLIGDHAAHVALRARDDVLREQHWHPLSAVAHYGGRWNRVGEGEDVLATRHLSVDQLVERYGTAPPHQIECAAPERRIALPPPAKSEVDRLLERRVTCRNFDRDRRLGIDVLSTMLRRMLGAFAEAEPSPGAKVFKKAHPSGGGLHPIEAYVLVRRADGVATGMYHYHAGQHALEPIRLLAGEEEEADRAALSFVAEQDFFADAQVLVALVARFRRTYWKYRRHSKAYRVVVLEAGHVSQNMYLAATELGLGAWITAAINDVQIEEAFALDGIEQSPLAVCGFGIRADVQKLYEFDPLHAIWPPDDSA